jgi:hypothetical protein
MKLMLIVLLLVGFFAPAYGQQQFCFSKNCGQTPATSFKLDRSDTQLTNIFRPLSALPPYQPVARLASSPPTRQFFQPTPNDNAIGTHSPSALDGSHIATPTSSGHFSTGQGGAGFTPVSPRF